MSETLTAAGIKLCLSLGLLNPTYDQCSMTLMQSIPPSDSFWQSPVLNSSCPNSGKCSPNNDRKWKGCINWAEYDTITGKNDLKGEPIIGNDGKTSGGKNWFCWRDGILIWIPEAGRWKWSFVEPQP